MHDSDWVEVVDDDPDVRKMLVMVLQAHGYKVRAHDGALAYLAAEPLSEKRVMLLDVRMPQMTGIELQAHMVKSGDTVPVIFMSGESLPHEQHAAKLSNAVTFLWKPFRTAELLEAIQEGLRRWDNLHQSA
jgi:two-component system response regulator FixJ